MASSVAPILNEAMADGWPTLAGSSDPNEKCEPADGGAAVAPPPPPPEPKDAENDDDGYDDWEDIEAPTENVIVAEDTTEKAEQYIKKPNPKILRHAASSPNLGSLVKIVAPTVDGFVLEGVKEEPEHDSHDDFSLVDSVASVRSINTIQSAWSTSSTPASKAISWKDKVAQLAREGDNNFGAANKKGTGNATTTTTPRKMMSNSRFVVVKPTANKPMKRCSQSTPNLHALDVLEEEDGGGGGGGGGGGDEEIMGASDAMDFYHRKAQGAKGRSAGLRMRPDEAKRKQISLHKKSLQRQGRR